MFCSLTAFAFVNDLQTQVPPFNGSTGEAPAMRFYRLHVTDVVGRPDGRRLLAPSEFSLYAPTPSVTRVRVSVIVNDADSPSGDLEMFYFRPITFHDFHPKAGNLKGGTEIHVYGSGFIDHPDLLCRFEFLFTIAVFVSPTEIVCPAPERFATAPRLSLTLNRYDYAYCSSCTWFPGRCAGSRTGTRCSWDCGE